MQRLEIVTQWSLLRLPSPPNWPLAGLQAIQRAGKELLDSLSFVFSTYISSQHHSMGQGWALTLTARVSLCLDFNSKEFCYSGEAALGCDTVMPLLYSAHNCANGWRDLNTHSIRAEVGEQPLPPQPHLPPWTAQLHPSRDAFPSYRNSLYANASLRACFRFSIGYWWLIC